MMDRSAIERWLIRELAARLAAPEADVDTRRPLATYGLQSVEAVGLVGELEAMLGRELSATLIWEYPTIEQLAQHLSADPAVPAAGPDPAPSVPVTSVPVTSDPVTSDPATLATSGSGAAPEPVAVIGIGCRFPGGADDPRTLWRLLCDGRDAVTEVPASRWRIEDFVDEDPSVPGKTNTRWGGFLDGVDRFDPQFFGISPREAERMDPQQRLLAEVTWEAMEDAGLVAEQLAGSSTGVFVGIATNDYALLNLDDYTRIDAHYGTGNAASIAANRLSYLFDLRGPSMAIDSACSSSLVAVHQACTSLARGDCELALAGGVNLILSPALAINFTKAGAMAPDGRCKSFDARADGYVRAEGAGVVVLKPLSRALADGDPVYGVILGGAVNSDGRTNGLMAPNPHAQEAVLRAAYASAGVRPAAVRYVEAHGTGTLLGDPIEAKALSAVIAEDRDPAAPCLVGSIKSNVGHLEAAAGVAGLIKALLVVQHRTIPPSIHFERPNPHIPFPELGLRVADALQGWPEPDGVALAGVSSFGFGGTNAHLVLREPPARTAGRPDDAGPGAAGTGAAPRLLTISARGPEALRDMAARYRDHLAGAGPDLTPRALTAAAALRRTHHDHRLACVGSTLDDFAQALRAFAGGADGADGAGLAGGERAGLSWGGRRIGRRPRVAFVFAGQGPRWWPLGTDLLESSPVLRDTLERCDEVLRRLAGWSLLDRLAAGHDGGLAEPDVAQPALCAVQVALAAQWRSWGIEPAVVIGHSVGEIAAAQVAGALDLADALSVALHRGRVIAQAPAGGGMAVIGLSLERTREVLDRLAPGLVEIAASNAPTTTVLSGDATVLDGLAAPLEADGIFFRALESVRFASHSRAMDVPSANLERALPDLSPRAGTVPMYSTVTGDLVDGATMGAAYWARNLRETVRFDPAIAALAESGQDTFIEISPHPMLGDAIRERLDLAEEPDTGAVVASLRREESVRASLLGELGALYTAGFPVDWRRVHGPSAAMVPLPAYPWQRERFWVDGAPGRARRRGPGHPLLAAHLASAGGSKAHHWSSPVDLTGLPYLRDHRVRGTAVLPASAMLDAALVAARQVLGDPAAELHDVTFTRLVPLEQDTDGDTLQLVLQPEAGAAGSFELYVRSAADQTASTWETVASGQYRIARNGAIPAGGSATVPAGSDPAGDDQPAAGDPAALARARERCPHQVDRAAHYQRLHALGLEYGEAFQGIGELWHAAGHALARIKAPEPVADDRDPYAIHPAILDACFQVVGAAIDGAADPGRGGTYLPVGVGRCAVTGDRARPAWAYATASSTAASTGPDGVTTDPDGVTTDPDGAITGRVLLFDEAGGPVGEIDGLALRRLDGPDGADPVADSLFGVGWREAVEGGVDAAAPPQAGAGWWLLLADRDDGISGDLALDLAGNGGCVTVRAGERWRRLGDREYEVDPARRDDVAALFAELRRTHPGPCRAVVHAWSLDARLAEDDAPDPFTAVQDLTCLSTLHLVQELAGDGLAGTPRLALLTRGAQRVADGESASPAQAPLWGLARVIAIEHGELRPVIVDLDPLRPAGEAGALLAVLTGAGRDAQICLRAGRRYRPTLERWSVPPIPEPPIPEPSAADTPAVDTPAPQAAAAGRPFDPERDGNFHVVADRPGILESVRPVPCGRREPGPDEIEIAVGAAGLNFSDVLKAMDLYPGLPPGTVPLGAECAGRVSAVGANITGYRIGDAVMGIARSSFAAHATTAGHLVVRTPDGLDDEQAAATPIAFLTAIHCLEHLARLEPGESVLIHAASGGVGLAALQVARGCGARVYATAGNAHKRALLRSMGVTHVMDSRSVLFADQIMEATGGRGVDVVLNCLSGPALTRGVAVLADGGRFIEIGKQDIYANSHLGLGRLKHNRSLFAVDMEHCFASQPAHVSRLLARLARGFADGEFTPLPVTAFGMSEAEAAFTLMARAQHTGKIVLRRTGSETVTVPAERTPVNADGSYLITGGLGGLGLETARYLADHGARHLVLMGRGGVPARARAAVADLESRVDTVTVFAGDITSVADVAALMALIDRDLPPLRGVIHAAGILDDRLLAQLDADRLRSVLAPKMAGGWRLHRATAGRELDFFVLFSSAAALLGSPGQGNYSAANAFLDALAAYRHANGLPAQSINWGPWSEVGLAARPDRGGQLADRGIASISPRAGIAALHTILPTGSPQVAVLPLEPAKLRSAAADGLLPAMLVDLVGESGTAVAPADRSAEIRGQLLAVEPGRRRRDILTRHVRRTIAGVLKLDPARVETDTPLANMGLDSLMSLDLRKRLETTLGVKLPVTLAWRYPTIEAIVPFLAEQMDIPLTAPTAAQTAARTAAQTAAAPTSVPATAPVPPPGAAADPAGGTRAAAILDEPSDVDLDTVPDLDIEALLLTKMHDIERGM